MLKKPMLLLKEQMESNKTKIHEVETLKERTMKTLHGELHKEITNPEMYKDQLIKKRNHLENAIAEYQLELAKLNDSSMLNVSNFIEESAAVHEAEALMNNIKDLKNNLQKYKDTQENEIIEQVKKLIQSDIKELHAKGHNLLATQGSDPISDRDEKESYVNNIDMQIKNLEEIDQLLSDEFKTENIISATFIQNIQTILDNHDNKNDNSWNIVLKDISDYDTQKSNFEEKIKLFENKRQVLQDKLSQKEAYAREDEQKKESERKELCLQIEKKIQDTTDVISNLNEKINKIDQVIEDQEGLSQELEELIKEKKKIETEMNVVEQKIQESEQKLENQPANSVDNNNIVHSTNNTDRNTNLDLEKPVISQENSSISESSISNSSSLPTDDSSSITHKQVDNHQKSPDKRNSSVQKSMSTTTSFLENNTKQSLLAEQSLHDISAISHDSTEDNLEEEFNELKSMSRMDSALDNQNPLFTDEENDMFEGDSNFFLNEENNDYSDQLSTKIYNGQPQQIQASEQNLVDKKRANSVDNNHIVHSTNNINLSKRLDYLDAIMSRKNSSISVSSIPNSSSLGSAGNSSTTHKLDSNQKSPYNGNSSVQESIRVDSTASVFIEPSDLRKNNIEKRRYSNHLNETSFFQHSSEPSLDMHYFSKNRAKSLPHSRTTQLEIHDQDISDNIKNHIFVSDIETQSAINSEVNSSKHNGYCSDKEYYLVERQETDNIDQDWDIIDKTADNITSQDEARLRAVTHTKDLSNATFNIQRKPWYKKLWAFIKKQVNNGINWFKPAKVAPLRSKSNSHKIKNDKQNNYRFNNMRSNTRARSTQKFRNRSEKNILGN